MRYDSTASYITAESDTHAQGGYSAIHYFLAKSGSYFLTDLVDHAFCEYCERDGVDDADLEVQLSESAMKSEDMSSYMNSFAGALKDGKTWLKKKKSVAEERMGDQIISDRLKDGKKWFLKKKEDLDFSDVKV